MKKIVATISITTIYYRIYFKNEWLIKFFLQQIIRFHSYIGNKFIEIKSLFQ